MSTPYKLPQLPAPDSDISEIIDFVELECLKNKTTSVQHIIEAISLEDENDITDGNPIDEPIRDRVEEAFNEVNGRNIQCNGNYPFELSTEGYVMTHKTKFDKSITSLYTFLLLATRLNMGIDRTHAGINGTELFEEISSIILSKYLGSRSHNFVFGTGSTNGSFRERINELCSLLNEGVGVSEDYLDVANPKDAGVDIVNWIPFSDKQTGKLISLGQCKTGTSWHNTKPVQPQKFADLWLKKPILVSPIKIYVISEALEKNKKFEIIVSDKDSIFFDRCRIMDYYMQFETDLQGRIDNWVNSALEAHLR